MTVKEVKRQCETFRISAEQNTLFCSFLHSFVILFYFFLFLFKFSILFRFLSSLCFLFFPFFFSFFFVFPLFFSFTFLHVLSIFSPFLLSFFPFVSPFLNSSPSFSLSCFCFPFFHSLFSFCSPLCLPFFLTLLSCFLSLVSSFFLIFHFSHVLQFLSFFFSFVFLFSLPLFLFFLKPFVFPFPSFFPTILLYVSTNRAAQISLSVFLVSTHCGHVSYDSAAPLSERKTSVCGTSVCMHSQHGSGAVIVASRETGFVNLVVSRESGEAVNAGDKRVKRNRGSRSAAAIAARIERT